MYTPPPVAPVAGARDRDARHHDLRRPWPPRPTPADDRRTGARPGAGGARRPRPRPPGRLAERCGSSSAASASCSHSFSLSSSSQRPAPRGSARSSRATSAPRALGQQVEEITVYARRGTITDRNGVELAVSEDATTVFANPMLIHDPAGVARPARAAPRDARGRGHGEARGARHGLRLPRAQARPDARREGREARGSRGSARSSSRAAPIRRARSPRRCSAASAPTTTA